MKVLSRGTIAFAIFSLIASFAIVFLFNQQPRYTHAFYHYNGAVNLAIGRGFNEDYLWVYLGAPDTLPAPSHLYWMPGTSIIASIGMFLFGTNYTGARFGLALCLWGAMLLSYWLGWKMGKSARHAWLAGILTLFSGFFMDTWGQTDTFAPYALFGGLALVFIGLGLYYFANSSNDRVDTWVRLRGKHTLQTWDPHTGAMAAADCKHETEKGQDIARVRLVLAPVKSVFLVAALSGRQREGRPKMRVMQRL